MDVLDKALGIVEREIYKLEGTAHSANGLTRNDAAVLTDYIKVLVTVRKDDRESVKAENLAGIPDDDLERLAREALAHLDKTEKPKEIK